MVSLLGRWYPVRRDMIYTVYRSKGTVYYYYQDDLGLHECIPKGNYQYEISVETISEVLIKSHFILVNLINPNTFWTKRQQ